MGDDWNSFMQSRPARIVLNALCAVLTAGYAVGGVMDIVNPGSSSTALIEQLGLTGYYALTAARTAVCAWVAIVFARATLKAIREE